MQKTDTTAAPPDASTDHGELISFIGLFLTLLTANIALVATQLTYNL